MGFPIARSTSGAAAQLAKNGRVLACGGSITYGDTDLEVKTNFEVMGISALQYVIEVGNCPNLCRGSLLRDLAVGPRRSCFARFRAPFARVRAHLLPNSAHLYVFVCTRARTCLCVRVGGGEFRNGCVGRLRRLL